MSGVGSLLARGSRSTVCEYGTDAVVKLPLAATPDQWMRAEQVYTDLVRRVGAPAPLAQGSIVHESRLATLYERIDGPSLSAALVGEPTDAAGIGEQLARIHLDLFHLVPAAALPRQQDRLSAKLAQVDAHLPDLAGAMLIDVAPSDALVVCHGDLHPGNVILGVDGPVLIDWFDASVGDPVADVARTCILLGAGGAVTGCHHLPGVTATTLRSVHDAYLASMRAALGFDDAVLQRWLGINALARIAEGMPTEELIQLARRTVTW